MSAETAVGSSGITVFDFATLPCVGDAAQQFYAIVDAMEMASAA
jgi:hypothetical protein